MGKFPEYAWYKPKERGVEGAAPYILYSKVLVKQFGLEPKWKISVKML